MRSTRPPLALVLLTGGLLLSSLFVACPSKRAAPEATPPGEEPSPATEAPAPRSKEARPPTDLKSGCCTQCIQATQKDPTGRDLSLLPCSGYTNSLINGTPALDATCESWFASHPLLVQDCRP